jgi:DNA polymerase-3 subunit delta
MHQKSLNRRLKVVKRIEEKQLLFESKPVYENKVGVFLDELLRNKGVVLSNKAKQLLLFSLSTDLSRYEREIEKLINADPVNKSFDDAHIERYVGIDRQYNVFELTKALSQGNHKRSASILGYFAKNTKDHPPIATLAVLYPFFTKVFRLHTLSNPKDAPRALGISPYFLSEYQSAARNFPMKRLTSIVSSLREIDLKCKGVGVAPGLNDQQIYQDIAMSLLG